MNKILVGKASFSQLNRDLCWSFYYKGKICTWFGYDDAYWWNEVMPTTNFKVTQHQGISLELNPETNEVFELKLKRFVNIIN